MALVACGAAVLIAAGALWIMSGTEREQPVLAAGAPESIRSLESSVAVHPNNAEEAQALAQAYLNAHQPGLAIAFIEGSPTLVRDHVRLEHVYARALIDAGRNDEALEAEQRVVAMCRAVAEGNVVSAGCDAVILVSAMRRADILRELLSLGVEDASTQPEACLVAYQNATREARVALQ